MVLATRSTNGHKNSDRAPLLSKIVAFSYADGATNGIGLGTESGKTYCFELLASDVDGEHDFDAWDRGEELRVFALTELPDGEFERIVATLRQFEQPTWPLWVPGIHEPSPALEEVCADALEQMNLRARGRRVAVVASSLLSPPIEVHQLHGRENPQDWFSFLVQEPTAVVK